MKNIFWLFILLVFSCTQKPTEPAHDDFQWEADRFADLKVLRYQVPGFEKLSLNQKKLVYYLVQAGLEGRDIMYDMNYRHNLAIRNAFENIYVNYLGDKETDEWKAFEVYLKRIWFSNGIHHHYSMDKLKPGFTRLYFEELLAGTSTEMSEELINVIFDPEIDAKKINLDPTKDLLLASAVNFYAPDISQSEAEQFYAEIAEEDQGPEPLSHGLNSTLVRNPDGNLVEDVWHLNGKYSAAIEKIIGWLEKASEVAENEPQQEALDLLIDYYKTGDLKTWDDYNVAWVSATDGDVDYINSFIEVYNDPIGYKGSYENIIEINDFEASERMQVLSENAQWFEDNSTIMDDHKKSNVVGVSYKVVVVAGESGDASPATPIGVNLPNANWIRAKYGSKSVSLGNIIDAYNKASGPGLLHEFANDEEEIQRAEKFGEVSDKLSTALHEVIGHASGQLEPGVGTPKETLKSYASALEEARADIVALYFIMDPKIIELGLLPSLEAGKAEYDSFISNGLLKQLRRIELGKDVEESHMRNRQLISSWVFEKGKEDNVIEKLERNGKIYYNINDYNKLRTLFGELLRELQRIKSEGDYEAGKALVENYGVKVDPQIHGQVLQRVEKLDIAPYSGFINPKYVLVKDGNGEITDIQVKYPENFAEQMLEYGREYGNLSNPSS